MPITSLEEDLLDIIEEFRIGLTIIATAGKLKNPDFSGVKKVLDELSSK